MFALTVRDSRSSSNVLVTVMCMTWGYSSLSVGSEYKYCLHYSCLLVRRFTRIHII